MESGLRKVTYTDSEGRKRVSLLPANAGDEEAENGIPVGPPRLDTLELPLEIEVRLNNELFHRGILTGSDALRRRAEVVAALQSALKVDAGRIVDLYIGSNGHATKESPEKQSNSPVSYRRQGRSR